MREYNVSVLIRDEWEDFDVASQKQAVDYVRRAIDAYQRVERVSLYKVRAPKAKVDSTAHNTQSTKSCDKCKRVDKSQCDTVSATKFDNCTGFVA